MRKSILLLGLIFLFSTCEKPGDCVKSTGSMTTKELQVAPFDKIIVYKGVGLVVTQGAAYHVEVRSGQNLINDIDASVSNNMLTLKDNTTCNWVRDYGQTVVYVTTPNLTEIHSKTEQNITSSGILTFPQLKLTAMDPYDGYPGAGTGDYIMQINNDHLDIENNNVARFTISGATNSLQINVWEGNGIIDTQNLLANSVNFFHRGANDLTIHPVQNLSGDLYNIGNVISVSRPPAQNIHVNQHYQGSLLFE